MSDDAEFDAFLKGEDALSRRLQAMPQAVPSAALDAAILQRARDLMAQEARPAAANDAGVPVPGPRLGRLSWRWRVPAGIAATVLTGVFANQAFQNSVELERAGTALPEEPVMILPAPAVAHAPELSVPKIETAPQVAAPMPKVAADKGIVAEMKTEYEVASPPPPPERDRFVDEYKADARRSTPESQRNLTMPPPVAAAPAAAPAAVVMQDTDQELRYKRKEMAGLAGAVSKRAATTKGAADWLAEIEAKLGTGKDAEVLAEWRRFRQVYPAYPVPQATEEKIKAIQP